MHFSSNLNSVGQTSFCNVWPSSGWLECLRLTSFPRDILALSLPGCKMWELPDLRGTFWVLPHSSGASVLGTWTLCPPPHQYLLSLHSRGAPNPYPFLLVPLTNSAGHQRRENATCGVEDLLLFQAVVTASSPLFSSFCQNWRKGVHHPKPHTWFAAFTGLFKEGLIGMACLQGRVWNWSQGGCEIGAQAPNLLLRAKQGNFGGKPSTFTWSPNLKPQQQAILQRHNLQNFSTQNCLLQYIFYNVEISLNILQVAFANGCKSEFTTNTGR